MRSPLFIRCSSALLIFIACVSTAAAHGTMQKIVEGKYLVNLSSAPIAPYVGQEQQNIIALSDASTDSLIEKDSAFTVEVHKDGKTLYSAKNLVATGGLLQFRYTYPEAGMYELFTSFQLPGSEHVYEPEDYWIQVVPKPTASTSTSNAYGKATTMTVAIIAALVGYILGRRRRA